MARTSYVKKHSRRIKLRSKRARQIKGKSFKTVYVDGHRRTNSKKRRRSRR